MMRPTPSSTHKHDDVHQDPVVDAQFRQAWRLVLDDGRLRCVARGTRCHARVAGQRAYIELNDPTTAGPIQAWVPTRALRLAKTACLPLPMHRPVRPMPPVLADVVQGSGRDCAAAAAALALVALDPAWVEQGIHDHRDGTVSIRLYGRNHRDAALVPTRYRVQKSLPRASKQRGAVWWRLVEKALAARGWETQKGSPNVYLEVLSGQPSERVACGGVVMAERAAYVLECLAQGRALCCSTYPARFAVAASPWLAAEHCYAVVGARREAATWRVQLHDPRGCTMLRVGTRSVVLPGLHRPFWLDLDHMLQNSAALCSVKLPFMREVHG